VSTIRAVTATLDLTIGAVYFGGSGMRRLMRGSFSFGGVGFLRAIATWLTPKVSPPENVFTELKR